MNPSEITARAREAFNSGKTRPYEFRVKQLHQLKKMLVDNSQLLIEAVSKDFAKPKNEAELTELVLLLSEIDAVLANLKTWMKPEPAMRTVVTIFDTAQVVSEPLGVVLVLGCWNYPINLALAPLIGAIAAGNCAVLKPSDMAKESERVICELFPRYLDQDCYPLFRGGAKETTELLKQKFDHIMYTGSGRVGKIIYEAAQKNLTPVTLELGGKSPLYLDSSVDMKVAAKRILWGKCVNAGQTCIAPDYMLCTKEVQKTFVQEAKNIIDEWYGKEVIKSKDFPRIINDNHFKRLSDLLKNADVAVGGILNEKERFISPTVVVNVAENDPIMNEEIFGPILPIVTVENVKEAMEFINKRSKPLSLYIFSTNSTVSNLILENTSSGSAVVNDCLVQFAVGELPFGGVGDSGIGRYHGKYSFDTFSHKKSVLIKNYNPLGEWIARYPPYTDTKLGFMKFIVTTGINFKFLRFLPHTILYALGIATGVFFLKYKVKPNFVTGR